MAVVINMHAAALRRLGMIYNSPSWRRFFMPWRWAAYPWVHKNRSETR